MSGPQHVTPIPQPALLAATPTIAASPAAPPIGPGWSQAYQEAQRLTAEAHVAYMQAMAQTHTAYLATIDRSFQVLSAQTVLTMATSGGAEAIGLWDQIGALPIGMKADLIQVSFDDVHFVPTYDVISHLVYVADEQDVATVIVDGKVLMREHVVLTVDTNRVTHEARALAHRIQMSLTDRNR